ncbi:uncharacterized protein EI90DRAFT_1987937 [Cantharellus anzutake]|uniref:uncharacterized protein n=1 Tax=Cantharellus anzutake TaxID=1750568 RepID=UPI001906725D|nr:uncharacterized protein EI90DRAFT_1987937 [Cantharellus anzutake]KAF8326039.1 hypothetical protein EI90DRAFT_1987937 [Cantharellus anzutake]
MTLMDNTWGVVFVFCVLSTVLSGILTVQVYAYHLKFPKDTPLIKGTVWLVFILELAHTAFIWVDLYHYIITNFANPFYLIVVDWRTFPPMFLQATLTCIVQLFYARRCWLVNRKQWIVPLVTAVLTLMSAGAAYYATIYSTRLKTYISFDYKTWSEVVWMGAGGLADILIIYCILSSLRGPRTGYARIDKGLRALGIYAFSTGALSTILNFTTLILFYASKKTLWYIGISFMLSRVYSISLMASLNLRGAWTRDADTEYIVGTEDAWFMTLECMGVTPNPTDPSDGHSSGSVIEIAAVSTCISP